MFGQRSSVIATAILIGPLVLPMLLIPLAVHTGSAVGALSLFLCICGAILISISKIPLWKRKKLTSFGWREMGAPQRRLYFIGYLLLTIGFMGCIWTLSSR